MKITTCRNLLLTMLMAFEGAAMAADSVSGQFVLDGKPPLKPVEVAAFRIADSFNPGKKSTLVLLTAKPVNSAAILKSSDPETAAMNDPAAQKSDYIQVFVTDGDLVSVNAQLGGAQYLHSTRIGLTANCTSKTPEHVACSVKTAEPVKFMDQPAWSLDLTFDSAVLANVPGK